MVQATVSMMSQSAANIKDIKSIDEFPYDSIDSSNTVRLLRLYRENDQNDAAIVGRLENFSLDAPPASGFTTLSYVWGEKIYHPKNITLNGHPFPILQSLYPALEEICDNPVLVSENLWWWIDSICINQRGDVKSRSERSSQIELMGRIYKQSHRTIVWLGDGTKDYEDAIEFLHVLAGSKNRLRRNIEVPRLNDASQWKGLEVLLRGPWWRRVWTLQEFLIAPELTFYCGSKSINRDRFRAAIYALWLYNKTYCIPFEYDVWNPAWNRRRLMQWHEGRDESTKRMGLVALMAYVGDLQATDDRDRIYSLLGLAKDFELIRRADYESSIESIYTELVKSFIEKHHSLDIICFAQLFNKHALKTVTNSILPSWVPDWRAQVYTFVVPLMASQSARTHIGNFRPVMNPPLPGCSNNLYAAGGVKFPEPKYSDDLKELKCAGVLIDHIDGLGDTKMAHSGFDQSTTPINTSTTHETNDDSDQKSRLIDDLAQCLVLDREDRYLSYPAPFERFRDEFQDLCIAAIRKPKEVHPHFYDWFKLNKHLRMRGHTLQTLFKAPELSLQSKSSMNHLMDTSDTSFISRLHDTKGRTKMALRLVTTNKGHIGMAAHRAQKGDLVCVLLGCSVPVILRKIDKVKDTDDFVEDSFEFIGECYLHGLMNGEALDIGNFETRDFRLA